MLVSYKQCINLQVVFKYNDCYVYYYAYNLKN